MNQLKYFGTDGIRGRVGFSPITPDFMLKLGWAVGKVLGYRSTKRSKQVIIGKDTRISGYMLESALESGLAAAGLSASLTGPMPTPAIAYLTRTFRAEVGIVISASHNPFYDNGIKFFSIKGTKLDDYVERSIEIELKKCLTCAEPQLLGKASRIADAVGRYIEFCKSTFPTFLSLKKLKIVVDCANGATYHIAPNVFRELGADVIPIFCQPNGININKKCGTMDISQLKTKVLSKKADLGIAYDGDGDRVIMVDHIGNTVNGDQMLYILAREYLYSKKLDGGIVGTLMSNMGLVIALKQLNIPFVRANIGDRSVLSMLKKKGWYIGGENSGHIILLNKTTTGDGIIVALQILSTMIMNRVSLYELCRNIHLLPQILINVYCFGLSNLLKSHLVKKEVQVVKKELLDQGRILLRQSGTEPYIRIMVEGNRYSKILCLAKRIASVIKEEINKVKN
ncbi:phosphoglucosamine mutase [Candidatus Blochmanniella vafra str. BVAF]|uniref:Phosphoglucosamine mutase n=1 Tax=Blochmanniella vafra (strain BVAF) TaxID=859654 RepID=E8Q6R8_BLOVB|nr:phosphoglucosamine mutase [Candidatus Blochmannia vafer]ADV33509.1 phosphoglucosamine mutase [Candidatus Blochmannia vafer str. BVAF]